MNAIEPQATCRWCGQPIGMFPGNGTPTWVHTGPRGAFPCRDEVTGMCLPTYAAPATPPSTGQAVGRYRVEPVFTPPPAAAWTPPKTTPAPGPQYGRGTVMPPPPRPRHSRPPARAARPARHTARRHRLRRPLTVLLPARLRRRRRPTREYSLARLAWALGARPAG